jgi:hypothetical protein
MNSLSLINLLLEITYCSMTLSNHGIIGLVRIVYHDFTLSYGMSFVMNSYLIPLISVRKLM